MIHVLRNGVVGIAAFFLLWQFVPTGAAPQAPKPSLVTGIASLAVFAGESPSLAMGMRVIVVNAWASIGLVFGSLALAYPAAILTGIGLARLRKWVPVSGAPLLLMRAVPLIGLVPLFNRWFGDAVGSQYLYVAFASWVTLATSAFVAALNVDPAIIDSAAVLGLREPRLWWSLFFPAIQRELLGSYQTVMGYVWAFALAAELLTPGDGLGHLVAAAYQRSDLNQLAALCGAYLVLGLVSISMANQAISSVPHLRLTRSAS